MEKKEKSEAKNMCKSVFKSGRNAPSKGQFTKKWIELINGSERSKCLNPRGKS